MTAIEELRKELEKGAAEIHARSVADFNAKWDAACAEIEAEMLRNFREGGGK